MAGNKRLTELLRKLKARTRADGTPLPGYSSNVAQLRAEIQQLTPPQAVELAQDGE